jgi:hypothetical protein
MRSQLAKALDVSAVGLSALCLIHCLALPALSLLLPVLGLWARAEWVHVAFIAAAAPVAILALVDLHARKPHSWTILGIAASGLALMLAGAIEFPSAFYERSFTVLGGLILSGAHIANWRRRGHAGHPN